MTKRFFIGLAVLIFGAVAYAYQQSGDKAADQYVGVWSGTWEASDRSGGFELTFEKGKDGAVAGRVSVTGDPTYKATIKTLSFEGKKMSALYDFPPSDEVEIVLAATFEGETAKGTWTARGKNGGGEMATGTITVTRK